MTGAGRLIRSGALLAGFRMLQKSILFATDLDPDEICAFHQACVFALAWKAKLLIVHVDDLHHCMLERDHSATQELTNQLHRIFPSNLAIEYGYLIRRGNPAQVIMDIEHDENVDLIVLGTHGRKGVNRMFGGSVAESVIRSANCPVLTLRQQEHSKATQRHARPAKFLVPIDFSVYSYAALDFASSLAEAMNASLTILHVDETGEPVAGTTNQTDCLNRDGESHGRKIWAQLRAYQSPDDGIRFEHQLIRGPAHSQIADFAELNEFDYVVLGTHGRSGVGRALLGSVAEQVVRNANCPVITVKPSNKRLPLLHY